MNPKTTIEAFDTFLSHEALTLEAIVVGGTALSLLGVITRETRDVDVLEPNLSSQLTDAAERFAVQQRKAGVLLQEGWLNNGPSSLVDVLPEGWRARLQTLWKGQAITLYTLGRLDLLCTKLFALCDRIEDFNDCLALNPTKEELQATFPWVADQDGHPGWPKHVRDSLERLAKALDYEL